MRYETSYVIVAGVAWVRRSRVELADGRVDDTTWVVTFDGEPVVRRGPGREIGAGELDGLGWELQWQELAPPFETPHRLLRRVAPSHMVTQPAILVSGRVGERTLDRAPGHAARLWGRRHARTWAWAHASTADGRWTHLLSASAPPLPRVSQHASERGGPGLPLARASIGEASFSVGGVEAAADPRSFVGLRYVDTDGSTIWCYHSEEARIGDLGGAMEIAARAPIEGWREEP